MATDVLNNKFKTTLHIGSKKLDGQGAENEDEVAVLSTFLPANFVNSLSKNDFKCARMEDCFHGDPKLALPGKVKLFIIRKEG